MKFDLDKYEPVKVRKAKFLKDHPDGRIIVEQINNDPSVLEYAEFKCYGYKDAEEQARGLPLATGHALELRDTEVRVSKSGSNYESVNFASWTENAEESAIGRMLDNAGYAGAPSREEMVKAEHNSEVAVSQNKRKAFMKDGEILRDSKGHTACAECGRAVSKKVEEYSWEKFGRVLCFECQNGTGGSK